MSFFIWKRNLQYTKSDLNLRVKCADILLTKILVRAYRYFLRSSLDAIIEGLIDAIKEIVMTVIEIQIKSTVLISTGYTSITEVSVPMVTKP